MFEYDCMRLLLAQLSASLVLRCFLFFLAHFVRRCLIQKKAAEDVFIHPKATRLFNNSFERRNFQLLLMVLQGALLPPIHTTFPASSPKIPTAIKH
jgi:hypothetical protein